jgi:DnaJ-class molecular chaperone
MQRLSKHRKLPQSEKEQNTSKPRHAVPTGKVSCHACEAGKGMPRKQAGRRGRIYVNVSLVTVKRAVKRERAAGAKAADLRTRAVQL